MPYPSQLTHEQLLDVTEHLIEEQGVEQVTLNAVAAALGVKAPSLYRYVDGRLDLLRQLNLRFLNRLMAAIGAAGDRDVPAIDRMLSVMMAYRQFAHDHPRLYLMSFAYMVDELRPDEDLLVQMVLPLQAGMAEIAGPERSLAALRGAGLRPWFCHAGAD
ncbi:MAG: TetR/AcrR family transcriptional regulator [Chloroflexota bacterium]